MPGPLEIVAGSPTETMVPITARDRLNEAVTNVDQAFRDCNESLSEAADLRREADEVELHGYGARRGSIVGAIALLNEMAADSTVPLTTTARTYFVLAERVNGADQPAAPAVLRSLSALSRHLPRPVFSQPASDSDATTEHPYDPRIEGLAHERPHLNFRVYDTQVPYMPAIGMAVDLVLESDWNLKTIPNLNPARFASLLVGQRAIRAYRDSLVFTQQTESNGQRVYIDNYDQLYEIYNRLELLNGTLRENGKQPISTSGLEALIDASYERNREGRRELREERAKHRRADPPNRLAVQYARQSRRPYHAR